MGVVIDEMITEVEPPRFGNQPSVESPPEGRAAHQECDSMLRRRLERIQERRLRLAAD